MAAALKSPPTIRRMRPHHHLRGQSLLGSMLGSRCRRYFRNPHFLTHVVCCYVSARVDCSVQVSEPVAHRYYSPIWTDDAVQTHTHARVSSRYLKRVHILSPPHTFSSAFPSCSDAHVHIAPHLTGRCRSRAASKAARPLCRFGINIHHNPAPSVLPKDGRG